MPACMRCDQYRARPGYDTCYRCGHQEPTPTWFGRFTRYPLSCIGHIATGAACGVMAAYGWHWPAAVWTGAFFAYQFGSGASARRSTGAIRILWGMDTYDLAVGFVPAYAVIRAINHLGGI